MGEYFADLFVNDFVILELNSVAKLPEEHELQLMNYLKATQMDDGTRILNCRASLQQI